MAISRALSLNPEKRKNSASSSKFSLFKKVKSAFSFRGGHKKETKEPHKDSALETIAAKEPHKDSALETIAAKGPKIFPFETLDLATNNFSHCIGRGGYGSVYRGKLEDGTEIAVKKFQNVSPKGRTEFLKEAEVLTGLQHRNVVKLLGYCAHNNDYLLVYEFHPHTLQKLLFSPNQTEQLDLTQRLAIIKYVANGLRYLHIENREHIVHRDIKPNNILLDQNLMPKIADFGLSRFFPEDQTHITATNNPGSRGYMSPEYMMCNHVSVKMDSYSFGVLMLELISGKQNCNFLPPPQPQGEKIDAICLLDWAYELHRRGRSLELLDPAIAAPTVEDTEQVIRCIEIGLLCVQGVPGKRPDMEVIESMLKMNHGRREASTILRPGVLGYNDHGYGNGRFSAQDQSDQKAIQSQGNQFEEQEIVSAKIPDDMQVDEHQSQHGSLNSNQINLEDPHGNTDSFLAQHESAQDQSDQKAIQSQGTQFEEQVIVSAKIPDDMLVDEHQSQHGSLNSNQINLEDPHGNSDSFIAQHESVCGGALQNESDQSEAQAPKGAEIANDLRVDAMNDSFSFPAQESGGCNKDEDEILDLKDTQLELKRRSWEKSLFKALDIKREECFFLDQLMKYKLDFERIKTETIKKWEILKPKSASHMDITPSTLPDLIECMEWFQKTLLASLKMADDTFEKQRRLPVELHDILSDLGQLEAYGYRIKGLQKPSMDIVDQQKQVSNWSDPWKPNIYVETAQSWYWPMGSWVPNEHVGKNDNVMNKYDKEMSLYYGRLKALGQKYEKGNWAVPSIFTHFTASDKVLLSKDSTNKERPNLLELERYVKDTLADMDVGIECLDRYINSLKEWSKGLDTLQHVGDWMVAVAEAQAREELCSQHVRAQQFWGDNRFSRSVVTV